MTAPLTVLVDDVRSFRDGRPCLIARSSTDGVALLQSLRHRSIDHLWLDHDLIGDDTIWPVVRLLEDAALDGQPFDVVEAHVHASRSGPAHQRVVSLRRAGYPVLRSYDLRFQRLEWMGDSILDALLAQHRRTQPVCCSGALWQSCARTGR